MRLDSGGEVLGGVVGLAATGNPGLVGVVGDAPEEPGLVDGVVGETEEAVSGVVPTGNPGHSPQYRLQPALQHSQLLLSLTSKMVEQRLDQGFWTMQLQARLL